MVISASEADDNNRHPKIHLPPPPTTAEMTMLPERSKATLPNFSSVPFFNIKWGCQKQLRCIKHSSDHDFLSSSSSSAAFQRRSSLPRSSPSEFTSLPAPRSTAHHGGIDAVREKLMLDFGAEVHEMQAAFLKKSDVLSTVTAPNAEVRPWNLRTRRAVCKEPNNFPVSSDRKPGFFPSEVKSPAMRYGGDVDAGDCDGGPRAKFSSSLSKQEIEEDFLAIMGTRPARRPKKRPKYVQKQIDAVFPGFWLSEITADMYKVNEQP